MTSDVPVPPTTSDLTTIVTDDIVLFSKLRTRDEKLTTALDKSFDDMWVEKTNIKDVNVTNDFTVIDVDLEKGTR